MDQVEAEFRQRELELEKTKFAYAQLNDRRQRRSAMWTVVTSTTLSALAVIITVVFSVRQLAANQNQYERTSRSTYYGNIVSGLGSGSVAVQTNSMQLLVQFVGDKSNYDGNIDKQRDGARDAIQVLTAFIEDLSTPTSKGLPDYLSPEPVVLSRAMTQLRKLTSNAALGVHSADISRANLHGISLPNYRPQGALLAVAADFRRANLQGLVLGADSNSLKRAYLTCADLSGASLGDADLQYADLTGADLRGADLGHTGNLTSAQLTGAMVNRYTVLPPGATAATPRWGIHKPKCVATVNQMTGMIAGQGYDPELPCPLNRESWSTADARKRFTGVVDDLVSVCQRRQQ